MELLTPILTINELCVSCDYCKFVCPEKAIIIVENKYYIETWACTLCEVCIQICPTDAIKKTNT